MPVVATSPPTSAPPAAFAPAIPAASFDALVDPNNWNGANRSSGQLIVAGDRFNPGDQNGNMGYGLQFQDTDIHSFQMVDGATLRWGISQPNDIPGAAVTSAVQWQTNAGYDPNAEVGARNPSVPTPPNDPLFFDGTRNQVSFGDEPIRSGSGADRVLMGTLFRMPEWAPNAQDNKAVLMNIHAPNIAPLSSPLSTAIDHGVLKIVGRTSTSSRPVNQASNNTLLHQEQLTNSSVGEWWAVVYEVRLSPYAQDDPFIRIWIRRGNDANWDLVADSQSPIGYVYDGYASGGTSGYALNGSNYPILASYYSYHKWGNDFDTSYPVRRIEFGFSGALIGDSFTSSQMRATLDAYSGIPPAQVLGVSIERSTQGPWRNRIR